MNAGGQSRTVLVTGAAGFIGSALCRRLCSLGHRVVGYDDLSRGRREYLPSGMRLVEGSILDVARLDDAMRESRPEWVIHLAAMHFIPDCIAHPDKTMAVNVEGTRCVLDCCRERSLRHVAFASSGAVYAPGDAACVETRTPLGPLEVYGESKVAGEQLARRFHEQTGISTSILRFFNAIGRHETNWHVVPHIFESLRRSDSVELGSTAPRRDYIDTRDIADAIVAVADRAEPLTLYNVGTGAAYSVDEVVDALRRILARPITIVQKQSRVRTNERMVLLADIGSIRKATGWHPQFSLDDTLRDLVAAYRL